MIYLQIDHQLSKIARTYINWQSGYHAIDIIKYIYNYGMTKWIK